MSYSHNQRKKNIKKFVDSNKPFVMANGEKQTFKKINNVWKLRKYIEPITASK